MNHNGRTRQRFHGGELPAFDALGDLHFAFSREQRSGAHLPQVNPYRIVGRLSGDRCRGHIDLVGLAGQPLFQNRSR